MAYDRYEPRGDDRRWRDDRSDRSWNQDRSQQQRGSGRDERGFFERAGDEIASWFGDDDAERRRREDQRRDERGQQYRGSNRDYDRGYGRDYDRDHDRGREREHGGFFGHNDDRHRERDQDRDRHNQNRGVFSSGGSSERDYNPDWRREMSGGRDRDYRRERDRDYRPMTGDYGRSSREPESGQFFAASGFGRMRDRDYDRDYERSQSPWGRDQYRRTSYAGAPDRASGDRGRDHDPQYNEWRRRHMDEMDRDYEDYRREHQSKFESDFGGWREKRQSKRQLLGSIREHMDVVGNDQKHVGTVDRVAGDRIILTKSDPESGGVHHSLSCSDIDKVEGNKVILDCSAEQAKQRWRDESRSRALFEREDQGQSGPRILDRSFEGTYR